MTIASARRRTTADASARRTARPSASPRGDGARDCPMLPNVADELDRACRSLTASERAALLSALHNRRDTHAEGDSVSRALAAIYSVALSAGVSTHRAVAFEAKEAAHILRHS